MVVRLVLAWVCWCSPLVLQILVSLGSILYVVSFLVELRVSLLPAGLCAGLGVSLRVAACLVVLVSLCLPFLVF